MCPVRLRTLTFFAIPRSPSRAHRVRRILRQLRDRQSTVLMPTGPSRQRRPGIRKNRHRVRGIKAYVEKNSQYRGWKPDPRAPRRLQPNTRFDVDRPRRQTVHKCQREIGCCGAAVSFTPDGPCPRATFGPGWRCWWRCRQGCHHESRCISPLGDFATRTRASRRSMSRQSLRIRYSRGIVVLARSRMDSRKT